KADHIDPSVVDNESQEPAFVRVIFDECVSGLQEFPQSIGRNASRTFERSEGGIFNLSATDEAGEFIFPPSNFSLKFEHRGFRTTPAFRLRIPDTRMQPVQFFPYTIPFAYEVRL